jgi:hypothetical protein
MSEVDGVLRRFRQDFTYYAPRALKIKTKSGEIKPFNLNDAQQYAHDRLESQLSETGKIRALVLKGRQQGVSTYIQGRFYWRTSTRSGKRAFILTHELAATKNLFDMAQRFHKHCPSVLRPHTQYSNANELYFDRTDSGYSVATAGSRDTGRSATAQLMHGSERAFWPNAADHLAGIGQTVPDSDGTEVIHETTANGIANEFYGAWQEAVKGRGQYRAIFIPWFWQREYRVSLDRYRSITGSDLDLSAKDEQYQKTFGLDLEQMAWRSFKIIDDFKGDKSLFDQEYPASPELAFTRSSGRACIDVGLVVVARKTVLPPSGVRVMGVDPAEYGDDDTHLSLREGRCISREHRETGKLDVMQVAGIAKVKALEWGAQVVNVDATGIGAGVWARLKELIEPLGIPVNRVMLGEGAHDKTRFRNRRNELAWAMKEWFEEGPVQIPDDDAYCAELTAPEYDYEGSNRMFRLESKEHMKIVRKIPSPDAFDSTMLTFASTSVPGREDDRDETPAGSWRVG